jgi:hypothetical protein
MQPYSTNTSARKLLAAQKLIKGTVPPVRDGLKMVWFNRAFPVDGPLGVLKIS